jgi:hypothetical protein
MLGLHVQYSDTETILELPSISTTTTTMLITEDVKLRTMAIIEAEEEEMATKFAILIVHSNTEIQVMPIDTN